ncbi:alpha/beta fold hydrolase [Alteromonas halophila]|uniref:AB hydrolase-1 domain-containing protein n=1 Tax=Alteromonas halophila TaxID=516698 RepID=A0A918JDE1_9ALTE|nr:alpha/beta fold hydrolase [Alteromonas halophila]GGW73727.1 hypothetical protein GCM10007391_01770 [Alteromonas halophila]
MLFVLPAVPPLGATFGLLAFSYFPWPITFDVEMPEIADSNSELIVLVHGKGDTASTWSLDFAKSLGNNVLGDTQQVFAMDWSDYSDNLFRCSNNGRRVGLQIGEALAASPSLKNVHLIGHSAGAFVVYGLCESLKQHNPSITVHATYLDPLGIYSGFDWNFGPRNFGSCADISDAYIDADDGVPGSNVPLAHAHTFNVTALKNTGNNAYQGNAHMWPVDYYRNAVMHDALPYWSPDEEVLRRFPRGEHTVLTEQ